MLKINRDKVTNNSVNKTIQNGQLMSCFELWIKLEHIAILDTQMPEPLFNDFEDNMFYLVKQVKLPITTSIFLGKRLSSIDLQFYTYKTFNYYYPKSKRVF